MKKLMMSGLAVVAGGMVAIAEMDSHTFDVSVIGTATNASAVVLRGELKSVKVDVAANATGTVSIATAESTVFSKTGIAADATYFPLAAAHTTAGVAATFVGGTNNTANAWLVNQPLAGLVTVSVIGESAGTNAYAVTVVYKK
jgi:hypothetical protein